jgi:ATP/maltotriose-dependent transcriptional regulator MalT
LVSHCPGTGASSFTSAAADGLDRERPSRPGWRGRNREWRAIADLLRAAEAGRGGTLLVEGRSGIGKSRLIGEAADAAAARGFMLARGRADEASRLMPLSPLLSALGESSRALRAAGAAAVRPDPVDLRFWLVERLQERLEQSAARGPLLLTVDDLHWADPTTLLALWSLIAELSSYPLVWVLSRTTGDGGGDLVRLYDVLEREGAERIALEPLDDQAVVEIVADVLGAVPEPDLLALAAGAGGNPFFLVELIEGLRDEGAVEITAGRARLVSGVVPKRFHQIARGRLRRLSTYTRHMLQVAAVLGRSFSIGDVAEMLGEPPGRLLPAVREAEAADVVVADGDTFLFRHELLWRAVTETLSTPLRQSLHHQAGEMLLERGGSALSAAAHLMHYVRPGDTHALCGLDRAVQEVLPSSPRTAADLAVRALHFTAPSDPDRFDRTVAAVYALTTAGRPSEAADLARTALHQATLPGQAARLRYELAHLLLLAGNPVDAVAEAEKAVIEPELSGEFRELAESVLLRGLFANQDYTRGRERAEAVIAEPESHSAPPIIGARMLLMNLSLAEGHVADALGHIREAVRVAAEGPIRARNTHPRLYLANLLTDVGEFDEAETVLREATEEIATRGHTAYAVSPSVYRARLRLAEGRLEDAVAEARAGLAMAEKLNMYAFVLVAIAVLITSAVRSGDLDEAAGLIERFETHHRSGRGATYGKALGWLAIGAVIEVREGPAKAAAMLRRAYTDPAHRCYLLMTESNAAPWLTRLAVGAGDAAGAEAMVATAERIAHDNPGFPTFAASAAHARGILRGDAEALTDALATHVRPYGRASAAEDLACVLAHATGTCPADREPVIHALDEALGLYQKIGASHDAARVRARLRRLGARRRHWGQSNRPVAGWDSLTPTERSVAILVAQGLTNPQVAGRMFVSPHTVKFHLRRIFQKLGVGSRVELARSAAENLSKDAPSGT